ncbi:TPA: glycosyltransferase [Photobacterium damselae]
MSSLADKLEVEKDNNNIQMFEKPSTKKGLLIYYFKRLLKNSILPPIEWIISYDKTFNVRNDVKLIIETGSKIINTSHDYIVYIENGYGLFGFNTKKINFFNAFIFKKKIKKKNLRGFVFYSEFSRKTTENIFSYLGLEDEFIRLDLGVIYPYAPEPEPISKRKIEKEKTILFCSSSFVLKGGLEIVECFNKFSFELSDFNLIVITRLNELTDEYISSNDKIKFVDFNLSEDEYNEYLENTYIYVHPTFFDTHALSLLENIKYRTPSITTKTFALNEYIDDGKTGILIDNPYTPYLDDGCINFSGVILDYAEKISQTHEVDHEIVNKLKNSILNIDENYLSYCLNLSELKMELQSDYVLNKWSGIINEY